MTKDNLSDEEGLISPVTKKFTTFSQSNKRITIIFQKLDLT